MNTNQQLFGKVALVTGGSRGIGEAIAIDLSKAGADVAVNYISRKTEADRVRGKIEKFGRRCIAVAADISRSAEVAKLIDRTERELGTIDILVNNAGICIPKAIEEIDEDLWDATMNTNLKSAFLVTQAILPSMRKKRWGRIINLSSVAAQLGGVVGPHYAASKAGIGGLTHAYAALLAKEGITVNAISPALIVTDMVRNNPRARPDIIPVGRFGDVEEVSKVAVMLACNGYITGQTFNVNGGWYMS